jgi:hypothetical protein
MNTTSHLLAIGSYCIHCGNFDDWFSSLPESLQQYKNNLINGGYDNFELLIEATPTESDLEKLQITTIAHQRLLLNKINKLNVEL